MKISRLAKITGRHRYKVAEGISSLIGNRILPEVTPASFSTGRIIALNQHYEQWVTGKTPSPGTDAEWSVGVSDGADEEIGARWPSPGRHLSSQAH